jgi:hypothetical protein
LAGIAKRVRVLMLPGLAEKGDLSDWIDDGGTAADLWALAEQAPDWSEESTQAQPDWSEEPAQEQPDATPEAIKTWPIMESKATHGLVGRIARLATENSEADPVAIIGTALAYAAAEFGRSKYIEIGDSTHHSRHNNAIVGESSRARKGTSYGPVRRIFRRAEEIRTAPATLSFPTGCRLQVTNGPLSSGEGLVWAIRDEVIGINKETGEEEIIDPGVPDKRLLVVEQELASAFAAFQRAGNNLSMVIRNAFDGLTIAPLTKNSRTKTTDPHICILGPITIEELKTTANRFQWLLARRPKLVPFPTPMPNDEVEEIAQDLAAAIRKAHENPGAMTMSNAAHVHWANVYPELTQSYPGILGAVTSRQETHAWRLAMTYALLDGADRIEIEHLEAALAFTRYAFDCAAYLFGDTEMDPVAERILKALADARREGMQGLTQTGINNLFGRNVPAAHLAATLKNLQERGRVVSTKQGSGGRPTILWSLPTAEPVRNKGTK